MHAWGRKSYAVWWAAALCVALVSGRMSPAQERTARVLVLPDPTPREPDLEKRFKSNSSSTSTDPARVAAYNRQRLQLIGQASAHMHSLATALQASVAHGGDEGASAQQAQVAGAIETLAANIYSAMGTSPSRPSLKGEKTPPAALGAENKSVLLADTQQLTALTGALQTEISRSSPDTLAVGVLIKSAQVQELAHGLRQRLQPEAKQHP